MRVHMDQLSLSGFILVLYAQHSQNLLINKSTEVICNFSIKSSPSFYSKYRFRLLTFACFKKPHAAAMIEKIGYMRRIFLRISCCFFCIFNYGHFCFLLTQCFIVAVAKTSPCHNCDWLKNQTVVIIRSVMIHRSV